jgi:hypothetical protein
MRRTAMLTEQRKSFSETFIVWNDNINLVGSIIPSNKGRASIYGTVKFKNGEKLSFSSKSYNYFILHQKIMYLCQSIAKFYGTNVIHRKECVADYVN